MQPFLFEEDPEIPEDLVLVLLKVRLLEDACVWHDRGIWVSSRLATFWNKVCLYLCEPIEPLFLYLLGGSSRFQLLVVSVLLTFFFTLLEVKQFCQQKNDGQNHPRGDQKGEAKERPKDAHPEGPKKRERDSLSCGRKLFHPRPLLHHQHANRAI